MKQLVLLKLKVHIGYLLDLHVLFVIKQCFVPCAHWTEYVNLDHECRFNHLLKEENTMMISIDPVQF